MRLFAQRCSLFALAASAVDGSKDSDYYRPGFVNPNIENKMYWKDSVNVLQDLSQFQSLYVKYEGCVWSKWGSRYSTYADEDEENDEDSTEKGCGAGIGDGEEGEIYWYLGRTQCFRANAAYTLYGVLKDDADSIGEGNYCSKGTYINSFFTTFGVEAFAAPLGLDTTYANSHCAMSAPNDENEQYYDGYEADDDEGDNDKHNFKNYAAYTSYGAACQDSKFVVNQYQGARCDGANGYVDTTNYLETFNEAIESLGCTEIYNANSYNNNQDRRKLENDDDDYVDYDVDFEELQPVAILQYSRACSIRQYPIQCPDPYKLLKKYDKAMTRALSGVPVSWKSPGEKVMNALSAFFLVGGAALLFFAWRIKNRVAQKPKRNSWFKNKEPEPASPSELNKTASIASVASKASSVASSAASTVHEAFEQVFVCSPKSEKQKMGVVELVDLDDSVASTTGTKSVGANDDAANPVLSWNGEVADTPSKKVQLKHDFPQPSEQETSPSTRKKKSWKRVFKSSK